MPPKTLRESLTEEARYGLADIRAAWERAWFGQPVTPSTWHQVGSGEPVAPADTAARDAGGGKLSERDEMEARCRSFFEPASATSRLADEPARDPIDR